MTTPTSGFLLSQLHEHRWWFLGLCCLQFLGSYTPCQTWSVVICILWHQVGREYTHLGWYPSIITFYCIYLSLTKLYWYYLHCEYPRVQPLDGCKKIGPWDPSSSTTSHVSIFYVPDVSSIWLDFPGHFLLAYHMQLPPCLSCPQMNSVSMQFGKCLTHSTASYQ